MSRQFSALSGDDDFAQAYILVWRGWCSQYRSSQWICKPNFQFLLNLISLFKRLYLVFWLLYLEVSFLLLQEIFEISHNGEHCTAESIKIFNTGKFAIMVGAPSSFNANNQTTIIALGHNEICQLYKCQLAREFVDQPQENGVVNRRSPPKKETRLTFDIQTLNSAQADF